MKKQSIIWILLLLCFPAIAQNKTYYIGHTGNDANDGLSITSAWFSLSRVNNINFKPGDQILLEGGQSFTGSILIDSNDSATSAQPVIISSYGDGPATINAMDTEAIYLSNTGGVRISNLILKGNGSSHDGIDIFINQTNAAIESISIDSLEVFGFGNRGCLIGSYSTDKGINNLTVEHSSFHDNGITGLETFGNWPSFSNKNFTISYCKFYNNYGQLTPTSKATGSGLIVSGVDGGLVEYCEAFNNGANNRSTGGGPVGIWAYDSRNIIIQHCESHHNKAGLTKDGGGFDLDGGCQSCIVQYCYSHDNEGYGFALVEYGSPNQFTGNVVRYNISQSDGRKNSYGAIALYAADNTHLIKNSEIYNNTLYVDNNNLTDGKPSAVDILTSNYSGVTIRNNIFFVSNGVDMIASETALSTAQVYFAANNYYSSASQYDIFWNGNHYTSLNQWKTAASGQETNSGKALDIVQDPVLMDAGSGSTIKPADGGNFHSLFGYTLNPASPLVDKAITTPNMGSHDFFDNTLPLTSNYDIGASQAVSLSVLPLTIMRFTGKIKENQFVLQWEVANEEHVEKYEIQKSIEGNHFTTIGSISSTGLGHYSFSDKDCKAINANYRLVYFYPNGRFGISQMLGARNSFEKTARAFYNQSEGEELQVYCNKKQKVMISIFSSSGSLLYHAAFKFSEGYNAITIRDVLNWSSGVYIAQIVTDTTSALKFAK